MENKLTKAVNELAELNDFLIEISRYPAKEGIEIIGKRNPDYLECVKSAGEMPEKSTDLMIDYGIWRILQLHSNYKKIWKEAAGAYFKLDSQEGKPQLVKALWTHVEMVIKKT
jgi:hypothetical protein